MTKYDQITGRFLAPFSDEEAHERMQALAMEAKQIQQQLRDLAEAVEEGPEATAEEQEWETRAKAALAWKEEEAGRLRAWLARRKGGTEAEQRKEARQFDKQSRELERQRLNAEVKVRAAEAQQSAELARLETARVKAQASVEIARLTTERVIADRQARLAGRQQGPPRKPALRCLQPGDGTPIDLTDPEQVISALRGVIGRWRKDYGIIPSEPERGFLNAVMARVRHPEAFAKPTGSVVEVFAGLRDLVGDCFEGVDALAYQRAARNGEADPMAFARATAEAAVTPPLPGTGGDNLSD